MIYFSHHVVVVSHSRELQFLPEGQKGVGVIFVPHQ